MLALLLAVAALPPLPPFPTELRPKDGSTAPSNTALFAIGDPAPGVDQVGVAATVDGVPATSLQVSSVGCCVVVARFPAALAEGSSVGVDVTSAGNEKSATFTVGPPDTTPPSFTEDPTLIDHGPVAGGYQLVIGVKASDDTQIGMITATKDGAVVGAGADGYVLTAVVPGTPGAQVCVDVVVTDVANNAAPPKLVCATPAPAGEGEGEGEGEPAPAGCSSSSSSSPSFVLAALAALAVRRRRRS